jgi:hypothetical protein
MNEAQLRDLATELLAELSAVVPDAGERSRARGRLESAVALPEGTAKDALLDALDDPATRAWVDDRLGAGDRGIPGMLGPQTAALGVHVVCPNRDYDHWLERPTDDPGVCPHDGLKLVREE